MEIVVTPETTYILIEPHSRFSRRIHTDGRDFPPNMETRSASFSGYSIGRWVDEDGDGRYDTLLVETRSSCCPRTYEATGIPFHEDNADHHHRAHLSRQVSDANVLHDEITVVDNALTRPWTVMKNYRRDATTKPIWWREDICAENNVCRPSATRSISLEAPTAS